MIGESVESLLEEIELLEESSGNQAMAYVKQSELRTDLRQEISNHYDIETVEQAMEEVREGNYGEAQEILGI